MVEPIKPCSQPQHLSQHWTSARDRTAPPLHRSGVGGGREKGRAHEKLFTSGTPAIPLHHSVHLVLRTRIFVLTSPRARLGRAISQAGRERGYNRSLKCDCVSCLTPSGRKVITKFQYHKKNTDIQIPTINLLKPFYQFELVTLCSVCKIPRGNFMPHAII